MFLRNCDGYHEAHKIDLGEIDRSAVVAVVRLAGVIDARHDVGESLPWGVPGKVWWIFDRIRPLDKPVACRGWPRLWSLPGDVLDRLSL